MLLGIALHGALSFVEFPWVVQDRQQHTGFGLFFFRAWFSDAGFLFVKWFLYRHAVAPARFEVTGLATFSSCLLALHAGAGHDRACSELDQRKGDSIHDSTKFQIDSNQGC